MTDFYVISSINLPTVLISKAKKISDSDFPSPCFDIPKESNFTSCETKNKGLGMIVMSFHDFKLREKQISHSFSYCELINSQRNGTIMRCF